MSWESTAHYYRILNEETARRLGGLHSAPVLLLSVDFAPIELLQRSGKWEDAASLLAAHARTLEAAGAQVLGLATNTMHIVAEQLTKGLSIPFIHIADPTAGALLGKGISRTGLLGTHHTVRRQACACRARRAACAIWAPAMLKNARPSASAYCKARSGGGNLRTHNHVAAAANPDTPINQGDDIQKIGCRSIRTSLSVPPPVAVTMARTNTPIGSSDRRTAAKAPLAAKTATPIRVKS
jgi:hypothetical protein